MDEVTGNIKSFINSYLNIIFKIGLITVILSTFFLFANLTTEIYDTPKLIVILAFTALLLILITLRFTISGKVVLVRTPLDIPLLLLLAVAIVSTILSTSPFVALLGDQLKIHGSLVSLIIYLLFYFILVNSLKNAKEIKWLFAVVLVAAQALAAISLLTYMGIKVLPAPWTHGTNFTTTGSSFSTTAVLALLIPFVVVSILTASKPLVKITNSVFLGLMGLAIALTGTWATWIGAGVGLVLTFLLVDFRNLSNFKNFSQTELIRLSALLAPIALVIVVVLLSFLPAGANPFYKLSQGFPREIQLPFDTSWKTSISAFRDIPFWGTGPSTYAFDFTNYKPVEFNASKFWNLRFDSSFNEYLQTLATLGGVGLIALISLTALFVSSVYKTIALGLRRSRLQSTVNINLGGQLSNEKLALAVSGLIFFVILFLHTSTLALWVIGLLVLASFMVLNIAEDIHKGYGNANLKGTLLRIAGFSAVESSTDTIKVDALPGILLAVCLVGVLALGFFGGKVVLADYHHRLALNAISQNQGIVAYNELVQAEKFNPRNDTYRTDLAQTNFALANAIAAAKAPSEASPTGSLTDQDKQNIQVLLQQSINEGRIATTLSPRSSINWEILALLYRQIAGVAQNALLFSLDSYGRAIFQDPLNPVLRVNVGGVYYAVKNYDMAIRFFTDAINLKADYPNAYYNLSVALKDKGDLANAQAIAEKLITLVDKNSQDYKVASDYLADLKNKIASDAQPPAASTSGSLQNKELPKVVELPKPEKIATPEAVKKPESTPSPAATTNP